MRILVLGAGGHGQVVAGILLRMADADAGLTVAGYLDDNPNLTGQRLLDLPILGRLADRTSVPHEAVVVAVGHNLQRYRLATEVPGRRALHPCVSSESRDCPGCQHRP